MTQPHTIAHLIGYLAEQPLHPGTGQALGAIDQPVAREGGSNIPVIPGSSHKGSIKHAITGGDDTNEFWPLFGGTDSEGGVLFSDIRLLLLPIRSSVGTYKWATSPYLLERLARDLTRIGSIIEIPVPGVADRKVLTTGTVGTQIYLEELTFEIAGEPNDGTTTALANFIPSDSLYTKVAERLAKQILIMSDDDFAWFARYGLPIYARNVLDKETKSSMNLWYEEHLPADTLMYGIVAPRGKADAKYPPKEANETTDESDANRKKEGRQSENDTRTTYDDFIARLKNGNPALKNGNPAESIKPLSYLQIGGDETVGRGFCRLQVVGA